RWKPPRSRRALSLVLRRLRVLRGLRGSVSHGGAESWAHTETRRSRRFRGAEGCFWVSGAAETTLCDPGSCDVVVCAGWVGVRGVKPASPGTLRGGMSMDPTGGNHIHS